MYTVYVSWTSLFTQKKRDSDVHVCSIYTWMYTVYSTFVSVHCICLFDVSFHTRETYLCTTSMRYTVYMYIHSIRLFDISFQTAGFLHISFHIHNYRVRERSAHARLQTYEIDYNPPRVCGGNLMRWRKLTTTHCNTLQSAAPRWNTAAMAH